MTDILSCPFCGSAPVVHNHHAPQDAAKQGIVGNKWAQIECASAKCAMRMVKTHRCGSVEDAIAVWNDRVT